MFRTDPLLLVATVSALVAEHPHLDEVLVRAICQHQAFTTGELPSLQEARQYLGFLTGCVDDATLRVMLGLAVPSGIVPVMNGPATEGVATPRRRRPRTPAGRPGWTQELFWQRYREAAERTQPPHSFRTIALEFEALDGTRGADVDHVRKLARKFGLPNE